MSITIKFAHDDRSIVKPIDFFDKHPNSIMYQYIQSGFLLDEPFVLNNIGYDDFCILLEVLNGDINQWDAPIHIFKFMYTYGFEFDNQLDIYHKKLLDKFTQIKDNKMIKLNNFIYGKEILFVPKNYSYFEDLLKGKKIIVSIQVIYDNKKPSLINMCGIPIYYFKKNVDFDKEFLGTFDLNKLKMKVIERFISTSPYFTLYNIPDDIFSKNPTEYIFTMNHILNSSDRYRNNRNITPFNVNIKDYLGSDVDVIAILGLLIEYIKNIPCYSNFNEVKCFFINIKNL